MNRVAVEVSPRHHSPLERSADCTAAATVHGLHTRRVVENSYPPTNQTRVGLRWQPALPKQCEGESAATTPLSAGWGWRRPQMPIERRPGTVICSEARLSGRGSSCRYPSLTGQAGRSCEGTRWDLPGRSARSLHWWWWTRARRTSWSTTRRRVGWSAPVAATRCGRQAMTR